MQLRFLLALSFTFPRDKGMFYAEKITAGSFSMCLSLVR
jgi:hypothetical protein